MEQPNNDLQRELNKVVEDKKDVVEIGGTRRWWSKKPRCVKVGYMKRYTLRRITDVALDERTDMKTESKVIYKQVALILLNGYWSIKFRYWFLWRWLAYVRQYHIEQLLPIVETAKKKIPLNGYLVATASLLNMKDTTMTMTRAEVEHILQGQSSGASVQ